MYRRYEDPYVIRKWLNEAKARLAEDPENEWLYEDVAELEERLNFAWQDDEYESEFRVAAELEEYYENAKKEGIEL